MEWTKVHPEKAGFYWVKLAGEKMVAELYYTSYRTFEGRISMNPMWFYTENSEHPEPEEFYGPLEPPSETFSGNVIVI